MKKRIVPWLLLFTLTLSACEDQSREDVQVSELAQAVLSAAEFPETMEEVASAARLEDEWGLSLADVEELVVMQSPITVHLYEFVIIKAKDGCVNSLVESLNGRHEKLIKELAFYPNQVDIANAAIVDSKGDFVYLIAHENAPDAEKALLDLLK